MTTDQRNMTINILLALIILVFAGLTYFTYQQWQQATPPSYTPSASAESSSLVVQLRDHLDNATYEELKNTIESVALEDVNYATIRTDSYKQTGSEVRFLSDIGGSSATYRVSVDTDTNHAEVQCPAATEQRDTSWTCGIDGTGDDHEH